MSEPASEPPLAIENEDALEEVLSRPSPSDVAFARTLGGDVLILGAGGKMGPSLARRVRRALGLAGASRRVVAASRFSDPALPRALETAGIEPLSCDLLDPLQVERLPTFENVLFLAGMKFGSTGNPSLTWALNAVVPALVARRFSASRVVVFSTGNVYPLVDPSQGGCRETDPVGPVGEYAQSCLGRERIFEHFSRESGTRVLLYRLFYAVDLRYGVLVDVARRVHAGESVDLTVPALNTIWQGDALSYALRCLGLCASPPAVLNVTGRDVLRVRDLALAFGRRFGREVRFRGEEGPLALLGDARRCHEMLGPPQVEVERLIEWVAGWVDRGGRSLGKPTGFEKADGRF